MRTCFEKLRTDDETRTRCRLRRSPALKEMLALGLPAHLIANDAGVPVSSVYYRRPAAVFGQPVDRLARVSRIKANIAQFPGKSYCYAEVQP